ncbi:hypothetical protein Pint_29018 [Pistacia integerrima]|uniref:Uncharacterized protein n=1 Tax=Pistacia integerrima TaxID=434235 RepID=A0ACC0X178_9ROSI|nr:hypothetical protein Pint_29018 [Pistacia integerrima]
MMMHTKHTKHKGEEIGCRTSYMILYPDLYISIILASYIVTREDTSFSAELVFSGIQDKEYQEATSWIDCEIRNVDPDKFSYIVLIKDMKKCVAEENEEVYLYPNEKFWVEARTCQKGYKVTLLEIFGLAVPVFVMMMSKVAFYTLITYFAASMGTLTLATHQVMVQTFLMCSVWGGPLSQTAQSFMPEFLYGLKWSLAKDMKKCVAEKNEEVYLYPDEKFRIEVRTCQKGYNVTLLEIFGLAAPVFVMMMSKVAFYTHYIFCYVDGNTHLGCSSLTVQHNFVNLKVEDLQKNEWCSSKFISFNQNLNPTSFLLEQCNGDNGRQNSANIFVGGFILGGIVVGTLGCIYAPQVQMLLKSLVIIGGILRLFSEVVGTSLPLLFPNFFTPDQTIIREAGQDLKSFSLSDWNFNDLVSFLTLRATIP